MAWTSSGAAVQVYSSLPVPAFFTAENLPLTSTSTIRIDEDDVTLRLFMNGKGLFQAATDARLGADSFIIDACNNRSITPSDWTDRDASPTQRIWYINATALPFIVDVGLPDQLYETNVPRQFAPATRTYCALTDLDGATWAIRSAELDVVYKDPAVIALPSEAQGGPGGWLMVMARYLSDSGGSTPNNSFAQIVAWWSDTSDFRGANTVGPFLLVDGANAWSEGDYARLWLGTPGAVVVQRDGGDGYDLYVYYSVDESDLGYGVGVRSFCDRVSPMEYSTALEDMNFKTGTACRRVSLEAFTSALNEELSLGTPGPHTDEDGWEPWSAVPGTLLGEVKLSFPAGTRASVWHILRDFFEDYDAAAVRFADPAPAKCEESTTAFSLFLSANIRGGPAPTVADATRRGSGHGLWRGRSMPDSSLVIQGGARLLTTLGKAFLCETQPLSGATPFVSPDQVVESGPYTSDNYDTSGVTMPAMHVWLDPDPVQLADGTWCVLGGASVSGSAGSRPSAGDFTSFAGTETDGCADAQSLLDSGSATLPTPGRSLPL